MNPEKILVRGVNWLGDAVMTTPALMRLREAFPGSHITLLTHDKLKGLWRNHPAVDAVETFDMTEGPVSIGRRLRQGQFELGLVLPNSPRSAFELWYAGIPRRVGLAQPWRNLLLTEAVPPRPGAVAMHKRSEAEIKQCLERGSPDPPPPAGAHHIYNYLHLTAALGANPEPLPPTLQLAPSEVEAARKQFQLDDVTHWLGVNPGAEYGPAKRWPEERFLAVMRAVAGWPGWGVVLFGGENNLLEAQKLEQEFQQTFGQTNRPPQFINLVGRTTLRELMAALKICRVLVTNDSGPMHVAAALGTPVVTPFGSTSPELTGPGLPGDPRYQLLSVRAACSPCFLRECPVDFRCMTGITVEQVVAAVARAQA